MIDHVWSVLCNSSAVDGETNTISLFRVLEQLNILKPQKKDIRLPVNYEIFSLWTRKSEDIPGRGKMRISFCDPNNVCESHSEVDIDLSEVFYYRTRVKSHGIKLRGPGRYKFVVELQQENSETWENVATIPLLVIYLKSSDESNIEKPI